mmetsp:Transcript_14642/g.35077  ORF Transcript_14642/g.35077 Transcript_14642/m.35077 type:complete len:430 (+) Transcript_14642:982-2271(+)
MYQRIVFAPNYIRLRNTFCFTTKLFTTGTLLTPRSTGWNGTIAVTIHHGIFSPLIGGGLVNIVGRAVFTRCLPLLLGLGGEFIVLLHDLRADGSAGLAHGLFKVCPGDGRNHIRQCIGLLLGKLAILYTLLSLNLSRDGLTDGILGGSLADLGNIGTGKALGNIGELLIANIIVNGTLTKVGLEDRHARLPVRKRDVNKLIETSGTHDTGVENIGSVGRSNDEESLARSHTIDLGKDLVDNTITCIGTSSTGTTRTGNGIHFIKEQNAGAGGTGLVEQITDVGLGTTEPHIQKLRTLDGNEIGSALVGNGLGHEGLTASGRAVEKNTARCLHTKLLKQASVLDGIPNHLLKLTLGLFKTTDVLPGNIRDLNLAISHRTGIANTQSMHKVIVVNHQQIQGLLGDGLLTVNVEILHVRSDALDASLQRKLG